MIDHSGLGCIICRLVTSNIFLDFSLISIATNSIFLSMKEISISWGKNYKLLVIYSLPQNIIKYHVSNKFLNKKKKEKVLML